MILNDIHKIAKMYAGNVNVIKAYFCNIQKRIELNYFCTTPYSSLGFKPIFYKRKYGDDNNIEIRKYEFLYLYEHYPNFKLLYIHCFDKNDNIIATLDEYTIEKILKVI